ncbi:MAG: FtsX-like permease family protein [Chitinophagaceae bacterium]|nr:MAG: FtsX-like permease family protein [Chitinophagaceae bacterium]
MFRHLFKMIWNRKKQNFLLITEMFVSFMVVFAVFTLLVHNFRNYRQPAGFEYENVWSINANNIKNYTSNDSLMRFHQVLRNQLLSMPEIQTVSWTGNNIPFAMSTRNGTLTHNKMDIREVNYYTTDDGYKDVLDFQIVEGRWFNREDNGSRDNPVVITAGLKQKLFGDQPAAGQFLGDPAEGHRRRVVGVIQDVKDKGDYNEAVDGVYERADTAAYSWLNTILVKVAPGAGADFEGRLFKTVASAMKDSNVEIEHLSDKRVARNNFSLVPIIVLLIVAGFLIGNVALGLFGVLWYNISKRKAEIGLRRAIGASSQAVSGQLVGEAMVISTLALIVGSFFAIQFPLLKLFDLSPSVYLIAWLLAMIFIYALVVICAFYPGRQAAAIHPAVALHEE